jgi:hypothetical protein
MFSTPKGTPSSIKQTRIRVHHGKGLSRDVRDAAEALRGLAIGGKLVCDQTGMGKSMLLLVTTYYARYHIVLNEDGQRVYKFTVLSVPTGVIKQWAEEVMRSFPELKLIISYDDAGLPDPKYKKYFISPTAMKRNPDHIKLWTLRFNYLFDEKDPDTGSTIILTSHDTLVSRCLRQEEVLKQEGIPFDDGEEHVNEDGSITW